MNKTAEVLAIYEAALEKQGVGLQDIRDVLTGENIRKAKDIANAANFEHEMARESLREIAGRSVRGVNTGLGSAAYKRQQRVVEGAAEAARQAGRGVSRARLGTAGAHAAWIVPTGLLARHLYNKSQEAKKEAAGLTPRQARIAGAFTLGVAGAQAARNMRDEKGAPIKANPLVGGLTGAALGYAGGPVLHASAQRILKDDDFHRALYWPVIGVASKEIGTAAGTKAMQLHNAWKRRKEEK